MNVAQTRSQPAALLSVGQLGLRFGGVVALDDVSFDVGAGRICGLIGPNGAGKTTLFNCLSRLYTPERGSILFAGESLLKLKRHEIVRRGIARTFQNLALFTTMNVVENVMIGAHTRGSAGFLASALARSSAHAEDRALRERAEALVEELGLGPHARTRVGELPFATQKRVELARGLASEPKLLLLDEPAGGLNHEEVDRLREEILALRDRRGLTVLIVEHHMNLVMRVSDQVVALDFGRKIADGAPRAVQRDEAVIRAYLGTAA